MRKYAFFLFLANGILFREKYDKIFCNYRNNNENLDLELEAIDQVQADAFLKTLIVLLGISKYLKYRECSEATILPIQDRALQLSIFQANRHNKRAGIPPAHT